MKENFERALSLIQADEGGGAIRAGEPGGAVYHGISLEAYQAYCKRHLRSVPDANDLFKITKEDEEALYREDYWNRIGADDLPSGVDYALMNAAVMIGVTGAKEIWLQARSSDSRTSVMNIMLLLSLKKLRSTSASEFGRGWANRIQRDLTWALALI